ncbi:MAG: MFS transporter [Candidatus Shapirobacteria bacterium]
MKKGWRGLRAQVGQLWNIPQARAYLLSVLWHNLAAGWFFATYVLFLLERGMSLQQANLINGVFMAVCFVFDPITGKLADRVGQRKVFVWGLWGWAASFGVYFASHGFWAFAVAEAVGAIGHSLISEALESWLRNTTDEKTAHETMSTTSSLSPLVFIPTALGGGLVGAHFGLEWPWMLAAGSCVIAAVVCRKLLSRFGEGKAENNPETPNLSVAQVAKLTLRHPNLAFSLVIAFGIGAAVMPYNMFWTVTLRNLGADLGWLGAMWIPIAVMTGLGANWARKQTEGKQSVAKAVALIGAPMVLPLLWPKLWPVVAFFALHELGRGAIRPVLFTYANRHIENHYRSTANSIRSAVWTLGGATGLIISGFLSNNLTTVQVWAISGVGLLGLALWARAKG